ncbi:extracellular solute-binding protein [Hungatella hathewayi]|uniref:extracellular solute-binding protein n=1 Tax=Hungatella hathewayi TaxID=154046 RepID=UPI003565D8C1
MATIKDIALRAGVSHGTVSNVLNKKGNVSVEKINLVEQAARELGFTLNSQAKQLRQGDTKRVCIIIPGINIKRYNDLFIGLSNVLMAAKYEIDFYYTNNLLHYEEELLERAISSNPTAIVVVSSLLKNTGIYNDNYKIIFVERYVKNMPHNSAFFSFDFKKAGKLLAERCIASGYKNVAILCEGESFSNTKDFVSSVIEVIESHDCNYRIFYADNKVGFRMAFDILFNTSDFDTIITDNEENVSYLLKAQEYNPDKPIPKIYTLAAKEIAPRNAAIRYELNYNLCGREIANYVMKSNKSTVSQNLKFYLENDGFCDKGIYLQRVCEEKCINLLLLSGQTSRALSYLLPNFTKITGIKVNLVDVSSDKLYENLSEEGGGRLYDLIRIDMVWLNELGKQLYTPLDICNEPIASIRALIPSDLSTEYYDVDGCTYTLPFDTSVQMLYYRKDLFEDALLKREYYENSKKQLIVPTNFNEFNSIARFFTQKYNSLSPTKFGTTLVFGSSVIAACDFLPRARDLGVNFFNRNGEFQMNTPLLRQALENYMEAYQYTDQSINLCWRQVTEDFAQGNTAMGIVFTNHASEMIQNYNSKVIGKIGYAPVPGGHPLLGGGVIGISKHSNKKAESLKFLQWLYSEKIASAVTYMGGYINHTSLPYSGEIGEIYPWIKKMADANVMGQRKQSKQSFDEFQFEKILGSAVRMAMSGRLDTATALEEAQRRCSKMFIS